MSLSDVTFVQSTLASRCYVLTFTRLTTAALANVHECRDNMRVTLKISQKTMRRKFYDPDGCTGMTKRARFSSAVNIVAPRRDFFCRGVLRRAAA